MKWFAELAIITLNKGDLGGNGTNSPNCLTRKRKKREIEKEGEKKEQRIGIVIFARCTVTYPTSIL